VAEDLALLGDPPDIVAVHDDRMVEALAGGMPLVISVTSTGPMPRS